MEILKRKILPWKTILLPDEWYRSIMEKSKRAKRLSRLKESSDEGYAHYAVRLAIYCFDRKYVDAAISQIGFDSWTKDRQRRVFACLGDALYDLGYREEAISFLERALVASENTKYHHINYYQLCFHLNNKQHWAKRHGYILNYKKLFPEKESESLIFLAKSYNDLRRLEEADKTIKMLEDEGKDVEILRADYYYYKGEYQQATTLYDKCESQGYGGWQPQFDYKRVATNYRTNQEKKWVKQAEKMGRRLAWDKFYTLDYLEDEGVDRISKIDQVIEQSRQKKRIIYTDKLSLCLRRIPSLIWKTYLVYPYEALFIAAGSVFVIMLIRALFKYA